MKFTKAEERAAMAIFREAVRLGTTRFTAWRKATRGVRNAACGYARAALRAAKAKRRTR